MVNHYVYYNIAVNINPCVGISNNSHIKGMNIIRENVSEDKGSNMMRREENESVTKNESEVTGNLTKSTNGNVKNMKKITIEIEKK